MSCHSPYKRRSGVNVASRCTFDSLALKSEHACIVALSMLIHHATPLMYIHEKLHTISVHRDSNLSRKKRKRVSYNNTCVHQSFTYIISNIPPIPGCPATCYSLWDDPNLLSMTAPCGVDIESQPTLIPSVLSNK